MALKEHLHRYRYRYSPLLGGSPGSPWRRMPSSRLLMRYGFVALGLALLYFMHLNLDARAELRAAHSATRFVASPRYAAEVVPAIQAYDWQPYGAAVETDRPALRERWMWKHVASGVEGDVFSVNDTAIKTYITSRTPLRNCVPEVAPHDIDGDGSSVAKAVSTSTRWPAEIPATLLLGGLGSEPNDTSDFVPLKDYFLTPSSEKGLKAKWHLLTPLFKGGNLFALAGRLRTQDAYSYRDLDAMYRPSFNRMLGALEKMHANHSLCHDDIKPENIFVADFNMTNNAGSDSEASPSLRDNHWMLADLGNVRDIVHPFHSTAIWSRWSRQHGDCRRNDVVRLVKTYLQFLRAASSPYPSSSATSPPPMAISPSPSPIVVEEPDVDPPSPTAKIEARGKFKQPSSSWQMDAPLAEGDQTESEQGERKQEWSFDGAFLAGSEPWSQLYWAAIRGPLPGSVAARALLSKSVDLYPPVGQETNITTTTMVDVINNAAIEDQQQQQLQPSPPKELPEFGGLSCLFVRGSCRGKTVDRELNWGMAVTETRARALAWSWVAGVPTGEC